MESDTNEIAPTMRGDKNIFRLIKHFLLIKKIRVAGIIKYND